MSRPKNGARRKVPEAAEAIGTAPRMSSTTPRKPPMMPSPRMINSEPATMRAIRPWVERIQSTVPPPSLMPRRGPSGAAMRAARAFAARRSRRGSGPCASRGSPRPPPAGRRPSSGPPPPPLPALGPHVDDAVGRLDHVEVVFDDHHRIPLVDEALEHLEQPLDVGEVQAGGRLVEDVERPPCRDLAELGGQLDPLRLAARQRRGGLAEPHVVEADIVQRLHPALDLRDVGEELERLLDRHVQHVGDRLALEADVERLAVVALAVALLARDVDVGEEVHLDLDLPVAAADLAAPALDVEREAPGLV